MKVRKFFEKIIIYRYIIEFSLFKRNCYFIKKYSVGDTIRTLPVISLFKECHMKNRKGKMVVLIPKNKAGLAEMNKDIDKVRIIPLKLLISLDEYIRTHKKPDNLYPDEIRIFDILPIYNLTREQADAHPDLLKIPDHIGNKSISKAKAWLQKKGIDPSKTLLWMPKACSSSSIDVESIRPVIDLYLSSGYMVLTNAFEKNLKAAKGTEPVSVPVDILFSAIQQGMTVIGVQSGFMDSVEWMHLSEKTIKIYILKTEKDKHFYMNRKPDPNRKIEKKPYGYTVAVSTEQDYLDLNDNLIRLSKLMMNTQSNNLPDHNSGN